MAEHRIQRRLAAIVAADVAGYSRLMGDDEEGTLNRLRACRRDVVDPIIEEHNGRIVKTTGDGLLIEFASVVEGLRCAIAIQSAMDAGNAATPTEERIVFRIGVNLGDVIIDGEDIFGDGVNVAARLESMADPGGICVSVAVRDQVRDKLDAEFEDAGEQRLKNIARPLQVFRVRKKGAAPALAGPLALPDKPSIAVLPFTNMSQDPEQEYFSDGITEDIITALSRLRWFFVIARNSTFVFKGRAVDVKQVGRELGVRYVLEGSVRKSGRRLRITAQLIDALNGQHIWAERYDHELDDIFEIQDALTRSVTAVIEPKLLSAESQRAEARPIEDLTAWDLVARALSRFWKMTRGDSAAGIALLRQAVERHPHYAPAHSLLAFALLVSEHAGWLDDDFDRASAATLAHRASALDDDDPWAYLALGYLAFNSRQTNEAVRCFQVALDLNPNFAPAYGYIGWALAFDGRSSEAISHAEKALRMSPRDPLNAFFYSALAAAHYFAGRFDDALAAIRQAVQLRPGLALAQRMLCACLAQCGRAEEARSAMATLQRLQPGVSLEWVSRFVPYTPRTMPQFLAGLRKAGLPER